MSGFPAQLRALRKRLSLSRAQAADILGISVAAIGHYERGIRQPPDDPIRSKSQILADLERLAKQRETK